VAVERINALGDGRAILVWVQFAYMTRKPLRVREGFLQALCRNIEALQLPERWELELMALAIAARGRAPGIRQELCGRALDALEILWPQLKKE